jgi:hypothetical protein
VNFASFFLKLLLMLFTHSEAENAVSTNEKFKVIIINNMRESGWRVERMEWEAVSFVIFVTL